jgi:hypothetical protein
LGSPTFKDRVCLEIVHADGAACYFYGLHVGKVLIIIVRFGVKELAPLNPTTRSFDPQPVALHTVNILQSKEAEENTSKQNNNNNNNNNIQLT